MSNPAHWEPRQLEEVSRSAYMRLLVLHQEEEEAAATMARSDAYPDFFFESSTNQFHEYVGPPDRNIGELTVRASRMALVDRLRDLAADKYPDFFVDSPHNGPPFHERFLDKGPPKDEWFESPQARLAVLGQSRVLQAFMRLQTSQRAESG
jgi:hypothetical protein